MNSSPPEQMARSFQIVSDQGEWVQYNNGDMILQENGSPAIVKAYQIAAFYREKYASDVKRVTFC
jgi:hypothetical protein